jgi:hypothetical protein
MTTSARENSRMSCAMQTIPKIVAAVRRPIALEVMGGSSVVSTCRLEQFDGIPVRIFNLDLTAGRSGLQVVSAWYVCLLQHVDECAQIFDPKHHAIPTAGLLLLSVRHRPRA